MQPLSGHVVKAGLNRSKVGRSARLKGQVEDVRPQILLPVLQEAAE
jgi:hypothetical protein